MTTTVATPRKAAPVRTYDAFLSYSSDDHVAARRIHRFLESFKVGKPRRRVKVYLDRTDMRGGELTGEIRQALQSARTLIVCVSPAAVDSAWVAREISLFREHHGDDRIAIVVVGEGDSAVEIPALRGLDCRRHDVRRGWVLGRLTPRARLELIRLVACITDVELRALRNWHRRRVARNSVAGFALALFPPIGVLSIPVERWDRLELAWKDGPVYAVAAEVQDTQLWVGARTRGAGPQGFRNYIRTTPHILATNPEEDYRFPYMLRNRAACDDGTRRTARRGHRESWPGGGAAVARSPIRW